VCCSFNLPELTISTRASQQHYTDPWTLSEFWQRICSAMKQPVGADAAEAFGGDHRFAIATDSTTFKPAVGQVRIPLATSSPMPEDGRMATTDPVLCYRAVQARDARFDGVFYTAVRTTGIYCRPSCPAVTPKAANVSFYVTAAAAHEAGFRACRRCRPDATPGSPEWNVRRDTVGRAMRLIRDGVVESDGVRGLAQRLGYTERHVNRLLHAELGAGPLALARSERARTARILIETTDLAFTDVAFAAGFASIRQFNDTMQQVYAMTPTQMRRSRRRTTPQAAGRLSLQLPVRQPFDADGMLRFLADHAIPGVESVTRRTYARTMSLTHGTVSVALTLTAEGVVCDLVLDDLRDTMVAVQRCRALLDLDADPVAIDTALGTDPLLRPLVDAVPGLRLPGAADARAVLVSDDRSVYALLAAPEVTAALQRCRPLSVATPYLVPHAALALGVRSQEIAIAPVPRGLFLGPSPTGSTSVGGGPPGVQREIVAPPTDAVPVLVARHWEVLDGCRDAAAG